MSIETALLVIGFVAGLIGWAAFWLNINTPFQTRIPVVAWPISLVCLLVAGGIAIAGGAS